MQVRTQRTMFRFQHHIDAAAVRTTCTMSRCSTVWNMGNVFLPAGSPTLDGSSVPCYPSNVMCSDRFLNSTFTPHSYACLLRHAQAGEWQHAVSLIQSMRATGYPPTVLTLSSVISA